MFYLFIYFFGYLFYIYSFVDDITWIKSTVNGRLAKGHGFYLQHAKETCLIGKKGIDPPNLRKNILSDVIISPRRGQSQKPEELYDYIEELVPNGNIFNSIMSYFSYNILILIFFY